ncbi:HSP20-like chaperone [Annulohypoxylon bovei var. microspora]|nr:HSP20-like chaperone [Annulohypoxylon bovei var. microspora]
MQSTRAITSRVKPHRIINTTKYFKPITTTTTLLPNNNIHTTAKMSMFGPRFYTPAEPNFTGLFRLIDDFDKYQNNGSTVAQGGRHARHLPTFTPKFDLRETENNFELHGELPGIEKENVHVEFTDAQTIVVRGRIERTYQSGTPPAGFLEKAPEASGTIAEAPQELEHHDKAHQPTVEDDTECAPTPSTPATTVAETEKDKVAEQPKQPQHKFWVSERSVGEFSRTFQFPSRVDTDNVAASLDNGILSVVVPKAKKHEGRRILIN